MLNNKLVRAFSSLAGALLIAQSAIGGVENKLLSQPADISHRSVHSVMLGLEQAGSHLVTVGERGFILISEDEGNNWQQMPVPVSVTLTAVDFVSADKGWAVGHGGVVLRTVDGGRNWIKVLDGVQAAAIEMTVAEAAFDPDNRRSKFRLREAKFAVESGADRPFLNVHFHDENNGIVVGAYGFAFRTDDGGDSWHSMMGQVPNMMGMHLYAVHQQAERTFLIGEQGSLFRSKADNSGYERIETPYEGSFFGMVSSADGDLLLYGLRGHLFRSTDLGDNWQQIPLPLPVTLTSATRLRDNSIVLVDETGQVLLSRDHGQSFSAVSIDNPSVFTDLIETASGDLVMSGIRGISQVPATHLNVKGNDHE